MKPCTEHTDFLPCQQVCIIGNPVYFPIFIAFRSVHESVEFFFSSWCCFSFVIMSFDIFIAASIVYGIVEITNRTKNKIYLPRNVCMLKKSPLRKHNAEVHVHVFH